MKPATIAAALAALMLLAGCAQEGAAPAPLLIQPGVAVGPIHGASSGAELIARFGADRVAAAQVGVGEGFVCDGVAIVLADPELPDADNAPDLMVAWLDPERRRGVGRVRIVGGGVRTAAGLRVGLTLKETEALLGAPFEVSGFGWDYGGTAFIGPPEGRVVARFVRDRAAFSRLTPADQRAVSGDRQLTSSDPILQVLDPVLAELEVRFGGLEGCPEYFAG